MRIENVRQISLENRRLPSRRCRLLLLRPARHKRRRERQGVSVTCEVLDDVKAGLKEKRNELQWSSSRQRGETELKRLKEMIKCNEMQ